MGKINIQNSPSAISEKKLVTIFTIILIAVTFALYYNAIYNHFSMDDHHINIDNPQTSKGISAIPDIFTTLYADESGMAFGYRPLVRTSFALEYQFTSGLSTNPYISHLINILLYIIAVLILYKVLRRLLLGYNPWFPFLITLLFLAHPTHTEVVASLKNRDVLFNFIFSFTAILQFVKWADTNKVKNLILGLLSFILAILSKETAIVQLAVFPLVLYFFTDIRLKKLGGFTLITLGIVVIGAILQFTLLPEVNRELWFWENPLVDSSFMLRISTGFYVLGNYIKLLFVPYPLLYYYGYNMLPVVGWSNPWVIVSLVGFTAIFVYAIANFRKKSLLSFVIMYFLINMFAYSNFLTPVPGIIGDRFVFFSSISFSIFIVWLFFKIFGVPLQGFNKINYKTYLTAFLVILIVIPFGYYIRVRNSQWRTYYSLYSSDMPRLTNSVKANNLYAHELMKKANAELAKPVNPYKFIVGLIDNAEKHYRQALSLDSTLYTTWNNLGIIYSKIHGNQARLRVESYTKQNNLEKAAQEKINSDNYFNNAIKYFHKAAYYNPDYGSAYFNLANAYDLQRQYDSSVVYFTKAIEADGGELVSMSRLANAYYLNDQKEKAIKQNEKIIIAFPESDMPFINLGNYAYRERDTINALKYFKEAIKLGTNPEVGKLLSSYYSAIGDKKSADYYLRKSYEAEQLRKKKK